VHVSYMDDAHSSVVVGVSVGVSGYILQVCTYIFVYTCVYVYIYVCACVCVCGYICMNTYGRRPQ